jgi:hypothetical protein
MTWITIVVPLSRTRDVTLRLNPTVTRTPDQLPFRTLLVATWDTAQEPTSFHLGRRPSLALEMSTTSLGGSVRLKTAKAGVRLHPTLIKVSPVPPSWTASDVRFVLLSAA